MSSSDLNVEVLSYTENLEELIAKSARLCYSNSSISDVAKGLDNCFSLYKSITADLMDEGYDEKESIEEARYVLPNAAASKIIVTMNARSLFNFFKLRSCNRAQKEIRDLSDKMLELSREISPVLFNKAGPDCVIMGVCNEGKFSCGEFRTELIVDE